MNKSFLIALAVVIVASILCVVLMYFMAKGRGEGDATIPEPASISSSTVVLSTEFNDLFE